MRPTEIHFTDLIPNFSRLIPHGLHTRSLPKLRDIHRRQTIPPAPCTPAVPPWPKLSRQNADISVGHLHFSGNCDRDDYDCVIDLRSHSADSPVGNFELLKVVHFPLMASRGARQNGRFRSVFPLCLTQCTPHEFCSAQLPPAQSRITSRSVDVFHYGWRGRGIVLNRSQHRCISL